MCKPLRECRREMLARRATIGLVLMAAAAAPAAAWAVDLMAPKEQQQTEIDLTPLPEFDRQQRGVPQSLFTWIKMAKGYEIEWDSFGRQGWYTQDPRFKPVEPTSEFTPSSDPIYIVFESAPIEDPIQFGAQWFRVSEERAVAADDAPMGRDVLEQAGHSRYGFLELKPAAGAAWPVGRYLVKIYITPIGQQPFHAANQVGTMRFVVRDPASSLSSPSSRATQPIR